LPWRTRRDRLVSDGHSTKTVAEDLAIDAVPIANNIVRCFLPSFPKIISARSDDAIRTGLA
jgi:hypothetical protein